MEFLKRYKLALSIAVLAVALFAIYSVYFSGEDDILLRSEDGAGTSTAAEQELVALLFALRSVALDGALFQDLSFQSLVDLGQELTPEPIGRANPFAPF